MVIGGAGGKARSIAAQVVARQEFAGYWEYLLEDAIFTAPAHPHWGGAPLIGPHGDYWESDRFSFSIKLPAGIFFPSI